MKLHSNNYEWCFSLIEIMVALVILSAVSVVAMNVSSTALGQTAYFKQKIMSPWVAENRLTKIRIALQKKWGISLDEETTNQGGIDWVTTVDFIKNTESLTKISISVALAKNPKASIYSLSGYLPAGLMVEK